MVEDLKTARIKSSQFAPGDAVPTPPACGCDVGAHERSQGGARASTLHRGQEDDSVGSVPRQWRTVVSGASEHLPLFLLSLLVHKIPLLPSTSARKEYRYRARPHARASTCVYVALTLR
jgi:hypothetical protein